MPRGDDMPYLCQTGGWKLEDGTNELLGAPTVPTGHRANDALFLVSKPSLQVVAL